MRYKESARSHHYGKIFGYDDKGKQIEELDLFKGGNYYGKSKVSTR